MGKSFVDTILDLRGTPCPLNYIKCKLALEKLSPRNILQVHLDCGEPEIMVISGLENDGFNVKVLEKSSKSLKIMVSAGAG
tara:strand:- start:2562 stop:2804 length:243 start_codon:yes stop_codon:yes gene_type:complete